MGIPSRVTVIGLGATGLPIASRLADRDFAVTGVEINPHRRATALANGLTLAELPAAADADAVILQVTNAEQVSALLADGLAQSMPEGSTLLLMSTVGPEPARRFADQATAAGIPLVDVPFTGGIDRARAGELNLFAAGDPADLERVRPVLAALGNAVECGSEVGDGQSFKLVNQLLTSVHICAAAEALALAEALGLDPAKAFDAVVDGAGRSWLLADRGPRMLQGDHAPMVSSLAIFIKDSALVAEAADQAGLDARLVTAAAEIYARAAALGLADADDSQVIRAYQEDR
ncbi:NAD(P)-dependent oxidoreductase [Ammonicoccus fulvus]|uniref:NAD(P)-dependent oxidoreductase n=1 Tax=Ammonicoccus fulvus TaxID=3138240 RepID=A0ABZ3FJQ5_9ACTN